MSEWPTLGDKLAADWRERIEHEINRHLGGDATVGDIMGIMLCLGWHPPEGEAKVVPARMTGLETLFATCWGAFMEGYGLDAFDLEKLL